MDLIDSETELISDDSDFCPEKHKDSNSEISEPEEDDQVESDDENETKKSKKSKKVSKRRKSKTATEKIEEEKCEEKMELDPEEEKRKADAIWAEFLGETETNSIPKKNETSSRATSTSSMSSSSRSSSRPETTKPDIPAKAPAATEIFEFAGETVKIPAKTEEGNDSPTTTARPATAGVKRAGGLSSVLNQLTKKNKLSVLEKTKLDWDGFKSEEGINEELQTHNRGREGFLERKDFLQRTDLRQFEIEKNMRLSRRK